MQKTLIKSLAIVFLLILVVACAKPATNGVQVIVYKSPTCGCCGAYASQLTNEGYSVEVIQRTSLDSLKTQYSIPLELQTCHTSVIGKYFVEGHVPFEAIQKLLAEQPDIDGIGVPGMPSGSPGMPGSKKGQIIVYAVKDGLSKEFMRV